MTVEQSFVFAELGKLYLEKKALEADNEMLRNTIKANAPSTVVEMPSEHSVPQKAADSR
jgi:hypothetical protein